MFIDLENLPGVESTLPVDPKFFKEWVSDDYTFWEAYDRSQQRKYAALEVRGAVAISRAFPVGAQIRNFPGAVRGTISGTKFWRTYGATVFGLPTVGGIGFGLLGQKLQSRGGRDAKPGLPPVAPGRRPRPIKPSRRASPGQTSKPFWSNGKPKCKKGFRYDFKRKLCVKIK